MTSGWVEVWRQDGRDVVSLDVGQVTIGSGDGNELAIAGDPSVSRLHAVLERFAAGWSIRDLGSRNGTFVNGERIVGARSLHPGDEILVGQTRLVLRGSGADARGQTVALDEPPRLTARERDVLIELCRPLMSGDAFTEPASIRGIAEALFVSDAAVKQHLSRLYDKFDLSDSLDRRRVRLANAAVTRGAVTLADLTTPGA